MHNLLEQLTRTPLLLEKAGSGFAGRKKTSGSRRSAPRSQTVNWLAARSPGQFTRQGRRSLSSRTPDFGTGVGSGFALDTYRQLTGGQRRIRTGKHGHQTVGDVARQAQQFVNTSLVGIKGPRPHYFGQ